MDDDAVDPSTLAWAVALVFLPRFWRSRRVVHSRLLSKYALHGASFSCSEQPILRLKHWSHACYSISHHDTAKNVVKYLTCADRSTLSRSERSFESRSRMTAYCFFFFFSDWLWNPKLRSLVVLGLGSTAGRVGLWRWRSLGFSSTDSSADKERLAGRTEVPCWVDNVSILSRERTPRCTGQRQCMLTVP